MEAQGSLGQMEAKPAEPQNLSPESPDLTRNKNGSMTPVTLGNDQPFLKGQKETPGLNFLLGTFISSLKPETEEASILSVQALDLPKILKNKKQWPFAIWL